MQEKKGRRVLVCTQWGQSAARQPEEGLECPRSGEAGVGQAALTTPRLGAGLSSSVQFPAGYKKAEDILSKSFYLIFPSEGHRNFLKSIILQKEMSFVAVLLAFCSASTGYSFQK